MQVLSNGGYAISNRMDITGEGSGFFAFARGWLLEVVDLERGEYCFISDGGEVCPTNRHFGVFYPSYSLVRSSVRNARAGVRGVGAVEMLSGLPNSPLIFETDFDGEFTEPAQAIDILNAARNRRFIEVNTAPSLLSIRTKRLIDEHYLIYPSIARIAARLKVSHAHLTRQFKGDYGLAPNVYLHHLRMADATFRLGLGEPIIDISHEVGFNDLSRFYKQFRKNTKTSPGLCRQVLQK